MEIFMNGTLKKLVWVVGLKSEVLILSRGTTQFQVV